MDTITALYEQYHFKLRKFVYRLLEDITEAEDLAQDVFVRLLQTPPKENLTSLQMQAWLYTTAKNLAIDTLRKRAVRSIVGSLEAQELDVAQENSNPQEIIAVQEDVRESLRVIRRLPTYQCLLLAFTIAGYSSKKLANKVGKSDNAVRMDIVRARKMLREAV